MELSEIKKAALLQEMVSGKVEEVSATSTHTSGCELGHLSGS